jgi:lysophospholipase L1-like esterase
MVRLLLFVLSLFALPLCGQSPMVNAADLPNRLVFLGDSITYGGGYVELLETALRTAFPKRNWEILNVGLPSETVSGLSEPGHAGGKFPRPCVLTRLDSLLEKTKPELLVVCYGMNCGIYHPHDAARAKTYRSGMTAVREKAMAAGAKVFHVTPPPFDPLPIRQRLLPEGLASYPQPFAEYDDVLDRYSDWLTERQSQGWLVADLHTYFHKRLAAKRKGVATYTYSPDGVHPNEAGHAIMAQCLCDAWGLKVEAAELPKTQKRLYGLVHERLTLMKDAWLSHIGHERPGMTPGLPMEQAQAKERLLLKEIRLCKLPEEP